MCNPTIENNLDSAKERSLREARIKAWKIRNLVINLCENLLETNRLHAEPAESESLKSAIKRLQIEQKLERAQTNAEFMLQMLQKLEGQLADAADLSIAD